MIKQNIATTKKIVRSLAGSPVVMGKFALSRSSSASSCAKGAACAATAQEMQRHAIDLMPTVVLTKRKSGINHRHQDVAAASRKHEHARRNDGYPLTSAAEDWRHAWALISVLTPIEPSPAQ